MKNVSSLLLVFAMLLLAAPLVAQHLVNDAASIVVPSGTYFNVPGDVTLQGNSTLTNNGHVAVGGDWTELNATQGYAGTGWLWFSGTADQSLTGTTSLPNLRLNNGNEVILANDLNITIALDFNNNGYLQLGNNHLTLSPGAVISNYGSSGYVKTDGAGTLQQTAGATPVVFPVGNSTYNPATLSNAGTSDVLGLRVTEQVLSDGTSGTVRTTDVVTRSWYIEEAIAGGSDATLTVQWNTSEETSGFDRSVSGIAHYIGGSWSAPASFSAAAANGTAWQQTLSNITSFSPFTVVDDGAGSLFPVEWLHFSALRIHDKEVQVEWATAAETNNAGFFVEQKLEQATDFEPIAWVEGAGNSSSASTYLRRVADNSLRSWYRLRQVDVDGNSSYSETREVSQGQAVWATVYPNPAQDEVFISLSPALQGVCFIQCYDAAGRVVFTHSIAPALRTHVSVPEVSSWSSGIYFVRIQHEDGQFVSRLLKK